MVVVLIVVEVVVVVVVVVSEGRHFEPSSWLFLGENLVTLTNQLCSKFGAKYH